MSRSSRGLFHLAITVLLATLARPGSAQQSPARLGIVGGATAPTGAYARDKDLGYHLGLIIDVRMPLGPLGLRFDGNFHELGYSANSTKAQIWLLNANAVLKIPTPTPVHPYLIGGAGIYNTHRTLFLAATRSTTDFGLNGGAGVRFEARDLTAFLEARYHTVNGSDIRIVPITLGVLF